MNAQWAIASGNMEFPPKELAADQCYYTFTPLNSTINSAPSDEYILPLYKISYMWFTFLGSMFTIAVAGIMSIFYGLNDPTTIPKELITPVIRKFIFRNDKSNTVQSAPKKPWPAVIKDTEL